MQEMESGGREFQRLIESGKKDLRNCRVLASGMISCFVFDCLPGVIVVDFEVQWSIGVINQPIDQFEQVAEFSMSSPVRK